MTLSTERASLHTERGLADGPVGATSFASVRPLTFTATRLSPSGFLGSWQKRNASATIGHLIANLESSGVLHNFRRIADGEAGDFIGMPFADSDLYKTLEAIGWESGRSGQAIEAEFVDMALSLIERTQDADGYLNTRVQNSAEITRWGRLVWSHELYCAGHLFQAAVAFSRGRGDDRLLAIAIRFADRILVDLGSREDGYDGHAEVETALVELYRLTGDSRYLDFAVAQVERRGRGLLEKDHFGREYFGDHETIDTVDEAIGHAVRQLYFATGVTDLDLQTGQARYRSVAERIWNSAYSTKTYVTGGQGSRHSDEAFGDAYELPPDRAYAETCAGIASFQWNWRLLLATGDGRYAAEMETVLYNTIAASVGNDGCHFFYTNPLQLRTGHRGAREASPNERLRWFECACCPPNLARLIASLHNYLATASDRSLQVHHLAAARIDTLIGGEEVSVTIDSDYPWSGQLLIRVDANNSFELAIRVPSWTTETTATVDGVPVVDAVVDGYLRLDRDWTGQHDVTVEFPMTPQFITPHPRIDAIRGTVALRRGPVVYSIEQVDQDDAVVLEDLRIDPRATITESAHPMDQVPVALTVPASVEETVDRLYDPATPASPSPDQTILTAIPYHAWANRGPSAMRVWIPTIGS